MSFVPNKIDIREFREFGYLQELNRRFLHPLGLALGITVEAKCLTCGLDRSDEFEHNIISDEPVESWERCPQCCTIRQPVIAESLAYVWDYRDDPEGIFFGEGEIDPEKARRVQAAFYSKDVTRSLLVGDSVQPIDKVPPK